MTPRPGLLFGIHHGGVAELPDSLATGKPDEPDEVNRALDLLQSGKQLLVRHYLRFTGMEVQAEFDRLQSGAAHLARYTGNGRKLDLVLSNWDCTGNMSRWAQFIERAIDCYGGYTRCLQICEEPNLYDYPGDGRFEHGLEAVIHGVKTAQASIRARKANILVGFNSVPNSDLGDRFWHELAVKVDSEFLSSLDYVGINMYPDVSEPVRGNVEAAAEDMLTNFRENALACGRIPESVPIHISENGWPTGPQRFYNRQAEVMERIVGKVCELRLRLNIGRFGLFCLRDADTANPSYAGQFGILRDDYSPKPAFETYRKLIQEFGE